MYRLLNIFTKVVLPVFMCLALISCSNPNKKTVISNLTLNTKLILLNNKFVLKDPSVNVSPINNSADVLLVNSLPKTKTAFEYYNMIFKRFNIIGFSVLEYAGDFSVLTLKTVARSKGANLVIVKKVYNSTKDTHIYDILYLKGDLTSSDLYWNRNISEALSMQDSINNANESRRSKIQSNHTNMYSEYPDKPVDQVSKIVLTDIDKIENQVSNIAGEWVDTYDKSRLIIREISSSTLRSYNQENINDSIKYYGAYLVTKNNSSSTYGWHNNDLKLQFNFSGSGSVYLNQYKMPVPAVVRAFPAKGIIMIALSSGEIRYLVPADINLDNKIVKKMYKNLPQHIAAQEPSIGKNPTYGSGMYGWVISTGLITLVLSIISFL